MKAENDMQRMVALGVEVTVNIDELCISTRLEEEKAERWHDELEEIEQQGALEPGRAATVTGKMQHAVTAVGDRVGRAYVRPFIAQTHRPMRGNKLGTWIRTASHWWKTYYRMRPVTVHRPWPNRTQQTLYVDASGYNHERAGEGRPCGMGAVSWDGSHWCFFRAQAPKLLIDQCRLQGGGYIAILGTAVVLLAVNTWQDKMKQHLLAVWEDNTVALYGIIRGSSKSPEVNAMLAVMWTEVARLCVGLRAYKVASAAYMADPPSRGKTTHMDTLGAEEVNAVWPEFLKEFYLFTELPEWKVGLSQDLHGT
jgi:hypothetical protein